MHKTTRIKLKCFACSLKKKTATTTKSQTLKFIPYEIPYSDIKYTSHT